MMWLLCTLTAWAEPTDNADTPQEETETSSDTEYSSTTNTPPEESSNTEPVDQTDLVEAKPPESSTPEDPAASAAETNIESNPPAAVDMSDSELEDEQTLELLQQILESTLDDTTYAEDDLNIAADSDEEEDLEFTNYRGNLYYGYQLHRWKSPAKHTLHAGTFAGDPQYYFQHGNQWGTTLGLRFQVSAAETLNTRYQNNFIGITGGMQFGALRLNTAASWIWEQYYLEEEVAKEVDFVTYRYDELPLMSGVLWEQTLTYAPDGEDFGLQVTLGFPFQVNGERDMGEAFTDAWTVSSRLNFSFLHLGYQYSQYPGQSIQTAEFGSGILF